VRTRGSLPIAGADEDFAVAVALFTMKLVNRHGNRIIGWGKISSVKRERKSLVVGVEVTRLILKS
jgi:hypothetical protein